MAASLASLVTWRNNEAAHRQIEVALHALAERTKRLEIIRGVTEQITRELDLTTLLELITRRTAELIGVPSRAIYLWDTIVETFIPRAWYGLGDWMQDVRFRMGEGIPGAIGQCREGMIINDYRASPYANQLFIEHTGITAVLASPLLHHGRLLGVITLNNGHTGRHFTEFQGRVCMCRIGLLLQFTGVRPMRSLPRPRSVVIAWAMLPVQPQEACREDRHDGWRDDAQLVDPAGG
jgi:transcriptional regulator with GAF, ATPase, and Fis domain